MLAAARAAGFAFGMIQAGPRRIHLAHCLLPLACNASRCVRMLSVFWANVFVLLAWWREEASRHGVDGRRGGGGDGGAVPSKVALVEQQ